MNWNPDSCSGYGDMHLKNWSLIENGALIELAPAYDLLNTTVLLDDEEESALCLLAGTNVPRFRNAPDPEFFFGIL